MSTRITITAFFDYLERSGLLGRDQLDGYRGVAADRVAYRLIDDGLLTSFQAKQIIAGRYANFFIGGKYKILDLLGKGGMGRVYLCEHLALRRLVAVKLMYRGREQRAGAMERFMKEARAAAQFDHRNLTRVFDVDNSTQGPYLVMEYIDGTNLHDLVAKRGRLETALAANYIWQAAHGLQEAHHRGLVHRDIKPGNMMVDRRGCIKLLDLGLAKFFHEEAPEGLTAAFSPEAILGTADFIAPEQALDSSGADIRADIYSLGCSLYFLLARALPAGSGSPMQKLLRHQSQTPSPVRAVCPDVPEQLSHVVERMMRKDPAARYATPAEVIAALSPFVSEPLAEPPASWIPTARHLQYRLGISPPPSSRSLTEGAATTNMISVEAVSTQVHGTPQSPSGIGVPVSASLAVAESSGLPGPLRRDSQNESPRSKRHLIGFLAGAVLVVTASAIGGYWLWPDRSDSAATVTAFGSRDTMGPAQQNLPDVAIAKPRLGAKLGSSPVESVVTLRGGGSSFIKPIMEHWAALYERETGNRVEYTAAGSSKGVDGVLTGFLDFGCSDAPLTDSQMKLLEGGVWHVPLALGAVVPTYNLTNARGEPLEVRFTGPLLANIYLGHIKKWSDPALAANNPGLSLPDQPITVVARQDGSGTTNIWTDYLSKSSADWKSRVGVGNSVTWPVGVQADKNNGVADLVSRTAGAIGYVELSYALANSLPCGSVRNRDGQYVKPSVQSISAAAAGQVQEIPVDLRFSLTDAPGPTAFPIVGTCWAIVTSRLDEDRQRQVVAFLQWATGSRGQAELRNLHYGPLPEELISRVRLLMEDIR